MENLAQLTRASGETYTNWINRRKMASGLSFEPFKEVWPVDAGDYWQYPKFKVKKDLGSLAEEREKSGNISPEMSSL